MMCVVLCFLQLGKMLGILVFAQLLLWPFSNYIMLVTELIKRIFNTYYMDNNAYLLLIKN